MSLQYRIVSSLLLVSLLAGGGTVLVISLGAGPAVTAVGVVLLVLLGTACGALLLWPVRRSLTQLAEGTEAAVREGAAAAALPVAESGEIGRLARAIEAIRLQPLEGCLSQEHLDDALDSTAGALILIGPDRAVSRLNSAARHLLGYTDGEVEGRSFERICLDPEPAGDRRDPTILRLAVEGHLRNVERLLVRKDGSRVPVSLSGSTLRGDDGEVLGFVCVAHDLSRQKQVEERIRASLRRKELLLREVHHRVKNNLQVVSSLLDLQSGEIGDPEIRSMFQESQDRIRSMALIHEQLYADPEGTGMDIHEFVEKLTSRLLESYGLPPDQVTLRLRLEEHPLDVDQAIAFGLILNELVANALKHAFSDGTSGEVVVRFHRTAEGKLSMAVVDTGKGLAADFDPQESDTLGLSLVASLAEQLGGTLQLESHGGTACRIDFPAVAEPVLAGASDAR